MAFYAEALSSTLSFIRALGSFALIEGTEESLSDGCQACGSAFHSFGQLSLKIFAFDQSDRRHGAESRFIARIALSLSLSQEQLRDERGKRRERERESMGETGRGKIENTSRRDGAEEGNGRRGLMESRMIGKGRGRLWLIADIRRVPTNSIWFAWVPNKVSTRVSHLALPHTYPAYPNVQ